MSNTDLSKSLMDAQAFLEQILTQGKALATEGIKEGKAQSAIVTAKSKKLAKQGEDILIDKLGIEDTQAGREALRKGAATGAAAGALALLLANRSGRKIATIGGLAGLGVLAFKAYEKNGRKMPSSVDEAIGLLKGPSADRRAQTLIAAMVAAAKADGQIDEAELELIKAHESVYAAALKAVIDTPADPKTIAAMSTGPQAAREIYAVSCRVANGLNESERAYLDALAMALNISPELAARLETDIRTGR